MKILPFLFGQVKIMLYICSNKLKNMVFKELKKAKLPIVSLAWDWLGSETKEGNFSGEIEIDLPSYWVEADVKITVIEEEDSGDYWTPPSFYIVKWEVEVFEIKIFDTNTDEYINLISEESLDIIKYIEENIEYE